jgi:UDP-N-acetylmuramate: L-alanyl-gamma-D-glutamyl-meso-diaminopimelate ligase
MAGEFNVRNAAMAAAAASFAGLTPSDISAGLDYFEGVARRQELKGEVNGIKVVDDFAHHPTAIRLAIQSLRQRHPGSRLWVLFEPRSNTTRRAVFQQPLAESLALADVSLVAPIPDLHKIPENDRLNPEQLATDIARLGGSGDCMPDLESIIERVKTGARAGDVIAVLSNGGFGGIHREWRFRRAYPPHEADLWAQAGHAAGSHGAAGALSGAGTDRCRAAQSRCSLRSWRSSSRCVVKA